MLRSEGQGGGSHVTSWRQSIPGGGNISRYTLSKFKKWREKSSVAAAHGAGGLGAGWDSQGGGEGTDSGKLKPRPAERCVT